MKVHLVGKNPVTISDKFFIHQGGQGSTFKVNNSVFKIFSDLNFTLPQRKLEELSVLNRKNIVKPLELLYDSPSCTRSIGFRMDAVDSAENATIFLTSRFQQLHNITNEDIKTVVAQAADTYNYIHSNKCHKQ